MNFKKFIWNKVAMVAIIFAIFYQFITALVYLPGYQHLGEHVDRLNVSVVDSDNTATSKTILNGMLDNAKHSKSKNVPKFKEVDSLKQAKHDINVQKTVLVIDIPKGFTKDLTAGKIANLHFYQNKYLDQVGNKVSTSVKELVSNNLDEQLTAKVNQGIILKALMENGGSKKVEQLVQQKVTANPGLASNLSQVTDESTKEVENSYSQTIQKLFRNHQVQSVSYRIGSGKVTSGKTLGIMFLGLGCFLSVMSSVVLGFKQFKNSLESGNSKLKSLLYYEGLFGIASVLSPILSVLLFKHITGISGSIALSLYLQNVLMTFVSTQFVSVSTFVLGIAGIVINLPFAMVQTILAGTLSSYKLLTPIYQFLHTILPLPYLYKAGISTISGINTGIIAQMMWHIFFMGLIAFALLCLIVRFRTFKYSSSDNSITE